MLWKTQHNDELKSKGHDENHSQSKYSIFITSLITSLINTTKYYRPSIRELDKSNKTNPLQQILYHKSFTTNPLRQILYDKTIKTSRGNLSHLQSTRIRKGGLYSLLPHFHILLLCSSHLSNYRSYEYSL